MTILKIARMGHPVLRRRADPVSDPSAPEIRRLVLDMIETMEDAPGIGLAAPQVHVPLRLVIFRVPAERLGPGEEGEAQGLTALCNPVIEPLGPDTEPGWEGCLSVPGLRGVVERWTHIRYSGLGLDGRRIEREARGMHARVVQHECDHLDGILYPQRMRDLTKLVFESEMRHMVPDARVREDVE
ncbi:MAG: peptide deformylase [Alphaproteobacteria bacterium]|nr:peptide deformylase [Alphaproteobacteria bacterium]